MTDVSVEIRDEPEERAYVVDVDGRRAGKAVYRMRADRQMFLHTEIDEEFSGMGLGTKLVKYALDDVRERGRMMIPICPLFAAYVERHPEYEDIVDREMTDRITGRRET